LRQIFKRLLPMLSGILLILSFPNFNFEPLAWIALVPLFFSVEDKALKNRLLPVFVFSVTFYGGVLCWLVNVSVPGTVALVAVLSLANCLFALYVPKKEITDIIIVPSLWVLIELIRTVLFTGFPWAVLGHSQFLNIPVIQIADITGAYGVSFIIVMVNYGVYAFFKKRQKRFHYLIAALAVLLSVYVYGYNQIKRPSHTSTPLKVAAVQGNIPQEKKWDTRYQDNIFNIYRDITLQSMLEKPDLVIWPETSLPYLIPSGNSVHKRLLRLLESMDAYLLFGAVRERVDEGGHGGASRLANSAFLFSRDGELEGIYDKVHLVPFGEYVPFERFFPWFRDHIDKPIGDFVSGNSFTPFRIKKETSVDLGESIIREMRFYKIGVTICFEDIFPYIAREYARQGAEILVNLTNDAWFGDSSAPYQHVQSSVFRAVENRMPVIRAANTGISCFINDKGRIISSVSRYGIDTFVDGYACSFIYPGNKRSLYTVHGDVFAYLCVFIVCVGVFIRPLVKDLKYFRGSRHD